MINIFMNMLTINIPQSDSIWVTSPLLFVKRKEIFLFVLSYSTELALTASDPHDQPLL